MLRRIFHIDRLQKPSNDLFQGVLHALRDPKEGPTDKILHEAKLQVENQLSRFRYTQAAFRSILRHETKSEQRTFWLVTLLNVGNLVEVRSRKNVH